MPSLATILSFLAVLVSASVAVLHFVAPRTKTTADDRLLALLEEALPHLQPGSGIATKVASAVAPV